MATSEEYADWIVKNEGKRGTPEFDTVAKAYQLLRSQTAKQADPTSEQVASQKPLARLAFGAKEPWDAAAQGVRWLADQTSSLNPLGGLMRGMTGKTQGDLIDAAANAIGGPGTFLGDVVGIKGASVSDMSKDIGARQEAYKAAREATGNAGDMDVARFAGNVVSPFNVLAVKAAPAMKVGGTVAQNALRGAGGGAVGATLAVPATSDNFLLEKSAQAGGGALAGAVLAPVAVKAGEALGRLVDKIRASGNTVQMTPDRVREMIRQEFAADGISVDEMPPGLFVQLQNDVTKALAQGQKLDQKAALRATDFRALGLPFSQGQVTRNPAQWTQEYNLRGIEGVGEPLQDLARKQTQGVGRIFNEGAAGAGERFTAGEKLMGALQGADDTARGNVTQAYRAFRESAGRDLDVPLQGLAQDYAEALATFGDKIPSGVRSQFKALGLESGKQLKTFSVEDGEKLIRVINDNFDPKNVAEATALNRLRKSVQGAIVGAADSAPDGLGAEAAHLAKEARDMAKARFDMIDSTPALKAAIDKMEPDQFVQRYVIGGKVNEITRMGELVGPEGRGLIRAQMVKHLQNLAFGANAAGDAAAKQAGFNRELDKIGRTKLVSLLGEQGADEMQRLGRVLAYITQEPAGAMPNRSGTGAMLASLAKKSSGMPWVNDLLVRPVQRFQNTRTVENALSQGIPVQPAQLSPEVVNALQSGLAPIPALGGASLLYGIR